MLKIRENFIHSINKLAGNIPSKSLINITGQKVIFPFYHCISDEAPIHIKHLYKVKNVKQFEDDLEFLLKNYKPLDFSELNNFADNKKTISKPSFLLTFDDGLSEFHNVIAPILLRKGIPAICFLNSDFIDNNALFYRYKASLLIEHFNYSKFENKNEQIQKLKSKYNLAHNSLKEILLSINFENKEFLTELADISNFNFSDYLNSKKPYLTSNQIISLKEKGFRFGSHSSNHPEYRFISNDEQIKQTIDSTNQVCHNYNLDYKYFSFPFTDYGVSKQFFDEIYNKNIVDLSFGCAGIKADSAEKNIQRISLEMNNLSAKQIINSELIYYIFRAIFGKNKIKRT
ncbi:MAG: hypothetical protein A2033_19055 [Bacteroidetes bacterium GWA2_31_9]|nr:MAG: hypothetical protein A2033_19055 [Bacteroidetes bacterium GWA2_31_9]